MKLIVLAISGSVCANEVNVYSAREEALIKPLLDRFSTQTGIVVNLVTGGADTLIKRMESEGRNTPADILLTTDVARLHRAKQAGVLRTVQTPVLDERVAVQYRDLEGYWYGLSVRHRVFVYAPDRVRASELGGYLGLADSKWRGRICIRSSANVYNQSLVAAMLHLYGEAKVERWVRGLISNLARPPQGGDRDQIRAVAAGQCDVAVINNYYLAAMLGSRSESERLQAGRVRLFWPDQANYGVHTNISGAGIGRYAKHPEQAIRLLEYLVGAEAQQWYATVNNEYPLNGTALSAIQKSWGAFKQDAASIREMVALQRDAVLLMDRSNWK
ncbi:MAG: extracellular solute-binding protein [Candidatus Eutrophobiaceae bacterium]